MFAVRSASGRHRHDAIFVSSHLSPVPCPPLTRQGRVWWAHTAPQIPTGVGVATPVLKALSSAQL